MLERLPALRLLVTTGMGNASIDVAAARAASWCRDGSAGNAMPELTIGMMIALTRSFAQEDAAVRRGLAAHHRPGPARTDLGMVGLGRLGIPVARLARRSAWRSSPGRST